jgi:hypothetical protein
MVLDRYWEGVKLVTLWIGCQHVLVSCCFERECVTAAAGFNWHMLMPPMRLNVFYCRCQQLIN